MIKIMNKFALVLMLLSLTACGGGGSSGSGSNTLSQTTFSANLRNGVTAGVADQSGTVTASLNSNKIFEFLPKLLGIKNAFAQSSSNSVSPQIATGDFVSIDSNGNVARIFNYSFPISNIKSTTNYLIVQGSFISPTDPSTGKPLVIDSTGNALNCYLYAIKKTASGSNSDTTCLSTVKVGSYDISLSSSNAHYSHSGFETRGATAYYTDWAGGKLYKWIEGASAGVKIFEISPVHSLVGMADVYLDAVGTNICVIYPAISLNGSVFYGNIYCGTDAGLTSQLVGDVNNTILAESRLLGKYLLAGTKKIDITSLVVSGVTHNGSNYGLPSGNSNIFITASGTSIQRAYAWSLTLMDANGNTCVLAGTVLLGNTGCSLAQNAIISSYFQTVIGLGSYTWAYGTSNANDTSTGNYLAKINNTSLALDPTNYLSATGLTSIRNMSLASDGRIVVTGLDVSGNTKYAFISSAGSITTSSTPPTFRLSKRLPL